MIDSRGNPFEVPGRWLRVNLHAHTTRSDGHMSPVDVAAWYWMHDYCVLALTEHEHLFEEEIPNTPPDKLLLPGVETTWKLGDGHEVDVLILGTTAMVKHLLQLAQSRARTLNSLQHLLEKARQVGAFTILAHPRWSNLDPKLVTAFSNCGAFEIYTHCAELENRTGFSVEYWERALIEGYRLWGVATDDSHGDLPDLGGGWIYLKTDEINVASILEALRLGWFYASNGAEFHDIRVGKGYVVVSADSEATISIVLDNREKREFRISAASGKVEARIPQTVRFVRIQCRTKSGKFAWTNPIFVGD